MISPSSALDDVVAQDICNLDRMVNLHSSVHSGATVLLKVLVQGSREQGDETAKWGMFSLMHGLVLIVLVQPVY
jgi:hypothetical protein